MATPGTLAGGSGTPQPTAPHSAHSNLPDPLQRYRSWEPKSMGVALLVLAIILFALEVAAFWTISSTVISSGTPFYTALLLGVCGLLVILGENRPRRVMFKAALVCTLLGSVLTAIQLIIHLVDLDQFKKEKVYCSRTIYDPACFQLADKQRLMWKFVPVFYLVTLSGMMLCIVLSISLYKVVQTWKPEINQPVLTAPFVPEGTAFTSVDLANVPLVESQQVPGSGLQGHSAPSARGGKRSLLVEKFLEGQPKLLGIVHIVLGLNVPIVTIIFITPIQEEFVNLGFVCWLTVQSVIAGTMSIVAEDRPTINMIRACLALNVLNVTAGSINAFAFLGEAAGLARCSHFECQYVLEYLVPLILLILTLLDLTISVVIVAYAAKSLRSLALNKMALFLNASSVPTPHGESGGPQ
ncbi:uncharacterized protein LOC144505327 [Mustelus asterias]